MKLITTFFTFIVVSSNIFAVTTSGEAATLETLSEHNLHLAYQDFLDYRATHPEAYDPTLQSPIAFAYELGKERFEYKLAFQMLSSDEISDPNTFSEADQKALHCMLIWTPIAQVASALETAPKPWLINTIYEIFPNDTHLFDIAKRADSKEVEVRRQASTELFDVMTSSSDLKTKRRAAEMASDIGEGYKSFLNDEQLESVREVLTTAINDESLSVEQRLYLAYSLIWASNSNGNKRLGTEEQRRSILDTVFSFAMREELSPHQRLIASGLVISANFFQDKPWHQVYTAPEAQRLAALAIVEKLFDYPQTHMLPPLLWMARKSYNPDNPSTTDESLLTEEHVQKLEAHFQKILKEGRSHDKIRILNQVAYNKVSLEVKRVAVEQTLVLSSQFLTSSENSRTLIDILSTYDQNHNHSCVATDEERTQAIQKLRPQMTSPDLCIHWRSHIVENILSQRDASYTNHLASQEAITEAIEYGLTLLNSSELDKHSRFWLAKGIFGSDHTLTAGQFNMLFPSMLFALSAQEEDEYQKENDVNKLQSSDHITPEQRQQVLHVLISEMNDTTKQVEIRKKRAEFIKSSTHATDEQKAAATIVLEGNQVSTVAVVTINMPLEPTIHQVSEVTINSHPEPTIHQTFLVEEGIDTDLLLQAVQTGNLAPYTNFYKNQVKQRMNQFLDLLAPGNDQLELFDASHPLPDRTKGAFKTSLGSTTDAISFQVNTPISCQMRDLSRIYYGFSGQLCESISTFMDTFIPGSYDMDVLNPSIIIDQNIPAITDLQESIRTRDGLMTGLLISAEESSLNENIAVSLDILNGTDTALLLQAIQTGDMRPYVIFYKDQLKLRMNQFLDSVASGDDQTVFIDPTIRHHLLSNHTKGAFKNALAQAIDASVIQISTPANTQLKNLIRTHDEITCLLYDSVAEFMSNFTHYDSGRILDSNIIIDPSTLSTFNVQEDIHTSSGLMLELSNLL